MSKLRAVTIGIIALLLGTASVGSALTLLVEFPAVGKAIKVKVMGIVDETGNVLFGGSNPGKVEIVDEPGRVPYQSTVDLSFSEQCAGQGMCFYEFGGVLPGKRIVIQHVSGILSLNSTPTSIGVFVNNGSGQAVSAFYAPFIGEESLFDQPVQVTVDANQIIEIQVDVRSTAFSGNSDAQVVTLMGYELDCSVVGSCAPIAQ